MPAGAQVERALVGRVELLEREDVGAREVLHVDEVAEAAPVARRVVAPADEEGLALLRRADQVRDEVRLGVVRSPRSPSSEAPAALK